MHELHNGELNFIKPSHFAVIHSSEKQPCEGSCDIARDKRRGMCGRINLPKGSSPVNF
jgi:hypothetical protein